MFLVFNTNAVAKEGSEETHLLCRGAFVMEFRDERNAGSLRTAVTWE
jgi:hypothetical protein